MATHIFTAGSTNSRFVETAGTQGEIIVSLEKRQVITGGGYPLLLREGIFDLTYESYFGKPIYTYIFQESDCYDAYNDCFSRCMLFPTKPFDEWFKIPLSLQGAELPSVIDINDPDLAFTFYYAVSASAFDIISVPPVLDQNAVVRIQVKDPSSGNLQAFNFSPTSLSVEDGKWASTRLRTACEAKFAGSGPWGTVKKIAYAPQDGTSYPYYLHIWERFGKPSFNATVSS